MQFFLEKFFTPTTCGVAHIWFQHVRFVRFVYCCYCAVFFFVSLLLLPTTTSDGRHSIVFKLNYICWNKPLKANLSEVSALLSSLHCGIFVCLCKNPPPKKNRVCGGSRRISQNFIDSSLCLFILGAFVHSSTLFSFNYYNEAFKQLFLYMSKELESAFETLKNLS